MTTRSAQAFRWFLASVLMILATAGGGPAAAQGLLSITLTVGGGCTVNCVTTRTFADAEALVDAVSATGLRAINPNYSQRTPATAVINFRGITANLDYPSAGADVVFTVPGIGFTRTFSAANTRAANERALETFLRSNQNNILSQILGLAVATTPTDPIAGNPNSLMAKMVEADFNVGSTIGPAPNDIASTGTGYQRAQDLVGINARFGRFSVDGQDANVIDLPLNYTMPLDDPRYALSFDLPLTYVEFEGAASYAASFGVGLRLPVLDNWTVTPALRAGFAGSIDLGSVAGVGSVSVTSNYVFSIDEFNFAIGNSLTYIQTFPLSFDSTTIDYDQQNVVLRNGIGVSGPLGWKLFGQATTWEVSVVNTQFLGDDVFVGNYTDIALSLGTLASVNGFTWDSFRLGLTYTFSADSDFSGLRANFGYQF